MISYIWLHKKQAPQAVFRLEPKGQDHGSFEPDPLDVKRFGHLYHATVLANCIPSLIPFWSRLMHDWIMNYSLPDIIGDTTIPSR